MQLDCFYRTEVNDENFAAIGYCNGQVNGVITPANSQQAYELKFDSDTKQHWLIDDAIVPRTASEQTCIVLSANRTSAWNFTHRAAAPSAAYVELLIIVDRLAYERKFSSNVRAAELFVYELGNIVSGYYEPLNIYVYISDIVIWAADERVPPTTYAEDRLDALLEHFKADYFAKGQTQGQGHDVLHLLTFQKMRSKQQPNAKPVGIAIHSSICTEAAGEQKTHKS